METVGGGGGEGESGARDAYGVAGEVGTMLGDEEGFVERWRQISNEEREGLVDMAVTLTRIRCFPCAASPVCPCMSRFYLGQGGAFQMQIPRSRNKNLRP